MRRPYVNGKPTHCQYRGCCNPLGRSAFKGLDNKWYCDLYCEERGIEYDKRLTLEPAARQQ